MKILVANIAAAGQLSSEGEFVRSYLSPLTRRNLAFGAPSGCEFQLRWSEEGDAHPLTAACPHLPRLTPQTIAPALALAKEEGFDGAIIACFGDPSLEECRARLDIPVMGFGHASLLMAATLGRRIGIVAPVEALIGPIRKQVSEYGLSAAVVSIVAGSESWAEVAPALVDSSGYIEMFQGLARRLIAKGADVILPACGIHSPALRLAPGAEERFPNGVTHIDGVPIVDVLAATSTALFGLIQLKNSGSGWRRSRATAHTVRQHSMSRFWDS